MSLGIIDISNISCDSHPYAIEGSLEDLIRIVQISLSVVKSKLFNKNSSSDIHVQLFFILEKLIELEESIE